MNISDKEIKNMSEDDLWAELQTMTTLDKAAWMDILSLPSSAQKVIFEGYAHMDWTKSETSQASDVIAILGAIGTIIGVVSGGIGIVTGVASVTQLLRGK